MIQLFFSNRGLWNRSFSEVTLRNAPCPCRTGELSAKLGVLAAVCGDGAVRVFALPTPCAVRATDDAGDDASDVQDSGRSVVLEPLWEVALGAARATCARWSPHEPSWLCCGLDDGSCAVWRLASTPQDLDSRVPVCRFAGARSCDRSLSL